MRLLFVTPTDLADPRGGRAMLARLHRDALAALLGPGMAEHRITGAAGAVARVAGQVDGATPAGAARVIAAIDAHGFDALWLDGSNLGRIAQRVRRLRPQVRILTFCHNVEARFFLGSLCRSWGLRALGVLVGNTVAERLAVRHSSDVVALSNRDGAELARLYGRGADHILPMALTDQLSAVPAGGTAVADEAPLLFVGGSFYANCAGIAWFADQVAAHVRVPTQVVGQGMETMRATLERAPGMHVVGAVERLEPLYRAARLVIAPIFDGSGMKTKVAEALMFGKHVAGTAEAFSGYAADVVAANALCDDAGSFVAAIAAPPPPAFDPAMRALYERDHSEVATRARLAMILGVAPTGV